MFLKCFTLYQVKASVFHTEKPMFKAALLFSFMSKGDIIAKGYTTLFT